MAIIFSQPWFGAFIAIAIGVALVGLAHWRWGDPDRDDRITAQGGFQNSLLLPIILALFAVMDATVGRWINAAIYLLTAALCAGVFFWKRWRRDRGDGATSPAADQPAG